MMRGPGLRVVFIQHFLPLRHLYFSYTLLHLKLRAVVNENLMSRPFSCPRQGAPSGRWGWCSCWSAPPRRGTHARSGCSSPPGRSPSPSRTSSAGWSTVWGLAPRCGNRRTGSAGSPGRSWTWISPTFWDLFGPETLPHLTAFHLRMDVGVENETDWMWSLYFIVSLLNEASQKN